MPGRPTKQWRRRGETQAGFDVSCPRGSLLALGLVRNQMEIINAVVWIAVLAAVLTTPTFLLRWLSGWSVLEQLCGKRIAALSISHGSFRWVRGRFGWVRVGLCVELYDDGLWMRMHFPANLITSPASTPRAQSAQSVLQWTLCARLQMADKPLVPTAQTLARLVRTPRRRHSGNVMH